MRSVEELIGRTDLLEPDEAVDHWKARGHRPAPAARGARRGRRTDAPRHCVAPPEPVLYDSIDVDLLQRCRPAIEEGQPVRLERRIENKNRAVGGLLSGEIARGTARTGLPEGSDRGAAARLGRPELRRLARARRELELEGDANDYTGKGLSGGTLVVRPPPRRRVRAPRRT